jgi:hypothetical protein
LRPDDHDHDLAGRDLLLQHFHEVVAGPDIALHIHEKLLARENLRQEVIEAERWPAGIVPPVVQKDFAGHPSRASASRLARVFKRTSLN